ncbi:MAG: 4Fe-4S binding protein [Candidatus Omnitrophota bacterium]
MPGVILKRALYHLVRKAATIRYPYVKTPMPDKFRGQISFDPKKCIGCKICMRDCPAGAIIIKKSEEGDIEAEIDLGRCIYCAQCVDSCPKKAVQYTARFELAQSDRKILKVRYRSEPKNPVKKQP